jgi:hypothetical protein
LRAQAGRAFRPSSAIVSVHPLALAQLGVIEIVRKGQPGLNSREAAEFRYLPSQRENGAEEDDGGFKI